MNAAPVPGEVGRLLRWLWSNWVRRRLAGLLIVLVAGVFTGALEDVAPPVPIPFPAPNFLTVSLVTAVAGVLVASPVSLVTTPLAYAFGYFMTILLLDAQWMTNPIYDAIGYAGFIGYCYVYALLGTSVGTALGVWLQRRVSRLE